MFVTLQKLFVMSYSEFVIETDRVNWLEPNWSISPPHDVDFMICSSQIIICSNLSGNIEAQFFSSMSM